MFSIFKYKISQFWHILSTGVEHLSLGSLLFNLLVLHTIFAKSSHCLISSGLILAKFHHIRYLTVPIVLANMLVVLKKDTLILQSSSSTSQALFHTIRLHVALSYTCIPVTIRITESNNPKISATLRISKTGLSCWFLTH